jgi:DNA-binding PadR family transcriptional regulator
MSELSKETGQQRMIRVLQMLDDNSHAYREIHLQKDQKNSADLLMLQDLQKSGHINGTVMTNGDGFPVVILQTRITPAGRQYLSELILREKDQHTLPKQLELLNNQIAGFQREIAELKAKNKADNLLDFFRALDKKGKLAFLFCVMSVFVFGYLCAKNHAISTLIDLGRELKP